MGEARKRSQTLLIVEGNHEKNKLFWLLFKCFPEISIDMENVWIYGTNIYLLYEDIVKEYGENWAEEEIDIDLPFVISKKQSPDSLRYKDDFTKKRPREERKQRNRSMFSKEEMKQKSKLCKISLVTYFSNI